jgi:macrophage erythroblast attacher
MGDFQDSTIKHHDHVLLEQPLLRLPYELLRNNFRSAHFAVEKENAAIKGLLKDAATACLNGRSSPPDVARSLDDMLARARALKRSLATCAEDEARLLRQSAARIDYMDDLYSMGTYDDVKYEGWSRKRLDRLLIDYLLRRGYGESAEALAEEKGVRDLVDVDTFLAMNRIRDSLRQGSVQEALAWCAQNKKELRKMEVSPRISSQPYNTRRTFSFQIF